MLHGESKLPFVHQGVAIQLYSHHGIAVGLDDNGTIRDSAKGALKR